MEGSAWSCFVALVLPELVGTIGILRVPVALHFGGHLEEGQELLSCDLLYDPGLVVGSYWMLCCSISRGMIHRR